MIVVKAIGTYILMRTAHGGENSNVPKLHLYFAILDIVLSQSRPDFPLSFCVIGIRGRWLVP